VSFDYASVSEDSHCLVGKGVDIFRHHAFTLAHDIAKLKENVKADAAGVIGGFGPEELEVYLSGVTAATGQDKAEYLNIAFLYLGVFKFDRHLGPRLGNTGG